LFEKITHIHLKGGNVPPPLQRHASSKRLAARGGTTSGGNDQALDLKTVKDRLRNLDKARLFKDNMKFLDRLRNSKGTLDMSEFSRFERQHKAYRKNLTEATNLIHSLHLKDNLRSTSVNKAALNEISSKGFITRSGAAGAMASTQRTTIQGSNQASADRLPLIGSSQNSKGVTQTSFQVYPGPEYTKVEVKAVTDTLSDYNA
jgi:hypothetical protein